MMFPDIRTQLYAEEQQYPNRELNRQDLGPYPNGPPIVINTYTQLIPGKP